MLNKKIRIAMINCLKANHVCAGVACLEAWNSKDRSFARYQGKDVELVAFMRCNGCVTPLTDDLGMQEKIERLIEIKTDIIHFGVCTKNKEGQVCPLMAQLKEIFQNAGIQCVDGTH